MEINRLERRCSCWESPRSMRGIPRRPESCPCRGQDHRLPFQALSSRAIVALSQGDSTAPFGHNIRTHDFFRNGNCPGLGLRAIDVPLRDWLRFSSKNPDHDHPGKKHSDNCSHGHESRGDCRSRAHLGINSNRLQHAPVSDDCGSEEFRRCLWTSCLCPAARNSRGSPSSPRQSQTHRIQRGYHDTMPP